MPKVETCGDVLYCTVAVSKEEYTRATNAETMLVSKATSAVKEIQRAAERAWAPPYKVTLRTACGCERVIESEAVAPNIVIPMEVPGRFTRGELPVYPGYKTRRFGYVNSDPVKRTALFTEILD